MKNILLILLILFAFSATAQIDYYPIKAGQYAIYNSGPTEQVTVEYKDTSGGNIAYKNHVAVVDTIFAVTSTTSLAELATFTRPSGMIMGISFPDSAYYTEAITLADDSTILYTKMTSGNNAVIDGADVITSLTGFNEIANPDMELDNEDWRAHGVVIFEGQSTEQVHNGSHSWKIETNVFNSGVRCVTFQVVSGSTYRCSAWVYVVAGKAQLARGVGRLADLTDLFTTGTGSWEFLTKDVVATSDGSEYVILTGRNASDTFYIDDVNVSLVDEYNIWEKPAVTVQPNILYLNDAVGLPQASAAACDSEGDWFWNSGTDLLTVYSALNPTGNIELGQRKKIVDLGTNDNITLRNFTIQHSNEGSDTGGTYDNAQGAVDIRGDNITITGCTIQKHGFYGLYALNSSNVTLDNNTFLRSGESYQNGHNLRIYATTTGVSDITFTNNISNYAGQDGGRILGDSKVNHITNVDISGNTFNYNNAAGFYVQKLNTAAIYNNTFDSNGNELDASEDYGLGVSSCDTLDIYDNTILNTLWNDALQVYSDNSAQYGSSHNVKIFRNYIDGAISGDCIGIGAHDDNTANNMEIYSNVLIASEEYGINLYHPEVGTASSVDIFNNTIYDNGFGGVIIDEDYPAVLTNNIFSSNGGIEVSASSSTTGLTTSNNLWYRTSGNVLSYNSSTYTTATITNFEASAQNTDPLFTNAGAGDFTVQVPSDAIENGVDVGLTYDIDGNLIILPPNIGAHDRNKNN